MEFMRLLQKVIIEGKDDGQAEGPPNIEQPIVAHKKKLKKIIDYDKILPIGVPSHIYGVLINKKYDIVFAEAGIGGPLSVLSFGYRLYVKKHAPDIALHNIPYFEKYDITAGGNVFNVPPIYGITRNHNLIRNNFTDKN